MNGSVSRENVIRSQSRNCGSGNDPEPFCKMSSKLKLPEGDPVVPYVSCYVGITTWELPSGLND